MFFIICYIIFRTSSPKKCSESVVILFILFFLFIFSENAGKNSNIFGAVVICSPNLILSCDLFDNDKKLLGQISSFGKRGESRRSHC